ncbi:MAG: hypothetical protein LAO09_04535 [Acidobacteriia bacterium]|nr:hypothetical protein [Terriglobia bacterium]
MKYGICCSLIFLGICLTGVAQAQVTAAGAAVPHMIKFSGTLHDGQGKALTGITGVTFALYREQLNGAPLWIETQNVTPDVSGHYTVSLGATRSEGLPLELFSSGEARWLGVQAAGDSEQSRVLLMSVPYALKAGDAATIGGLPPTAFVLAVPVTNGASPTQATPNASASSSGNPDIGGSGTAGFLSAWTDNNGNLGNSVVFQKGTGSSARIGIGLTNPLFTLDVKGSALVRGTLEAATKGTANASKGFNSNPLDIEASSFNSGTGKAVMQHFEWQAEPTGNNSNNPGATLNLLFGQDNNAPAETGLLLTNTGIFTFAPGQTFPGTGTITGVTAGTDLTGGGNSGDVTLNLDLAQTDARYAQLNANNNFVGAENITGSLSVTGTGVVGVFGSSTQADGVMGVGDVGVYGTDLVGITGGGGVEAVASNADSIALEAVLPNLTGHPIGVLADGSFTTGGIGLKTISHGDSGSVAALLTANAASGKLISGQVSGTERFSVEGTGRVKSNTSGANNAASFTKDSTSSPASLAALQAENAGVNGEVAWLGHISTANHNAVIKLVLPTGSTSNFLVCNIPDGVQKCHIDSSGSFVSGSDFAEALPVRTARKLYEPGDVLVMSSDGKAVQKTAIRYSRQVVGVYSTRPAVLGAEKGEGVTRVDANDVPVAITGIVPTKVSAENGPIRVGDLLVTSSKPGYAMKATNPRQLLGAVIGKALEPLAEGSGTVRVLVILR